MIPYFVCFFFALVFTFVGEKNYKKYKNISLCLFSVSILILTIFAGCRDYSVGTDVRLYGMVYYNIAKSFQSFSNFYHTVNAEYLYLLTTYISANFFQSAKFLLMFLELLPLVIIYRYILKDNYKNITLALLCYMLLYFNTSLNILRQTPAIFLGVCAYKKICNKQYIKALIYIFVATLFHSSSFILLILFPIKYLAEKEKNIRYIVIICLLFLVFGFTLHILLNMANILPEFITRYFGYIRRGETNLNIKFFIFKIIFEAFLLLFYKYYKNDKECNHYIFFSIIDILFYFLSYFVIYGYRLSYFFIVYHIFFIPKIYEKIDNPKDKMIFKYGIIVLMILYWIIRYVIIGYDGTIPFKFL